MSDWMEAEERIERAQQLSESQQWDAALDEIEAALRIDPRNAPWHGHRGYILDQLSRFDDAIKAYRTALRFGQLDRDVLMALGMDFIRAGRFARARETFARVIENWPEFEPAYCHSIIALAELGDYEQAEQFFYLAQQLADDCPHCFYHVAWVKFRRQDYPRALFAWNKVLEIHPQYPGIRRHIADCHRAMGDIEQARKHYLQAIREDPGDTDMLKDYADLLADAGQLDDAAEKYRLIIELEPDYVSAHTALGEVALKAGPLKDAVARFRAALEIEPTCPGIHARLGEALLRQGRLAEAKRHLSVELERNPDDAQALMTLGNCLLEMGRPTAASYCFRRLLNNQPDAPGPHHNLAVCSFINGKFDEGIEHCRKALELRPDYVMAMHKLALAWLHTGRTDRAAQVLAHAHELEPDNPAILQLQKRLRWYRLAGYVRRFLGPGRWALGWVRKRTRP